MEGGAVGHNFERDPLKQQWTIKISSPFFLFLAWRPSWFEVGITGHNFGRGPSKDHSTKVWLQLAQWFLRKRLKCESLRRTMDGRTDAVRWTPSDGKSSHGLWSCELKNQPIRNKNCLWWPCLLMDRNEMSTLYRGPPIDVSYQVSVHLAKRFQRRRIFLISQSRIGTK